MEFRTTMLQNNKKWVFVEACVVLILVLLSAGVDPSSVWNTAFGIAGE